MTLPIISLVGSGVRPPGSLAQPFVLSPTMPVILRIDRHLCSPGEFDLLRAGEVSACARCGGLQWRWHRPRRMSYPMTGRETGQSARGVMLLE
jgi:hypothetical protein